MEENKDDLSELNQSSRKKLDTIKIFVGILILALFFLLLIIMGILNPYIQFYNSLKEAQQKTGIIVSETIIRNNSSKGGSKRDVIIVTENFSDYSQEKRKQFCELLFLRDYHVIKITDDFSEYMPNGLTKEEQDKIAHDEELEKQKKLEAENEAKRKKQEEYYAKLKEYERPYPGMSEYEIGYTKLGKPTEVEKCPSFDQLDYRRKIKTYRWNANAWRSKDINKKKTWCVVTIWYTDYGSGYVYSVAYINDRGVTQVDTLNGE